MFLSKFFNFQLWQSYWITLPFTLSLLLASFLLEVFSCVSTFIYSTVSSSTVNLSSIAIFNFLSSPCILFSQTQFFIFQVCVFFLFPFPFALVLAVQDWKTKIHFKQKSNAKLKTPSFILIWWGVTRSVSPKYICIKKLKCTNVLFSLYKSMFSKLLVSSINSNW